MLHLVPEAVLALVLLPHRQRVPSLLRGRQRRAPQWVVKRGIGAQVQVRVATMRFLVRSVVERCTKTARSLRPPSRRPWPRERPCRAAPIPGAVCSHGAPGQILARNFAQPVALVERMLAQALREGCCPHRRKTRLSSSWHLSFAI